MDVEQLQSWLGLPRGTWPPSPEILLGSDPAAAQDRALALMEKLRPHQLMQPELVTEGMNRIAQALMALERPKSDSAIPVMVVEPVQPLPEQVKRDERPPPQRRRNKHRAEVVPIPAATSELPAIADRRRSYRDLARLRHLIKAWSDLGPILGVPSHELSTSLDVFRFLETTHAAAKFSPAGRNLATWFVHQPSSLTLFRDLQHSQRQQLAAAWAEAAADWTAQRDALRTSLRANKPRPTARRRFRYLVRRVRDSHAIVPGVLLILSMLTAWLRSR